MYVPRNRIDILCATDSKFASYCGIMLTSVLESNKDCEVGIYIIVNAPLPKKDLAKFEELKRRYGAEIDFLFIDDSLINLHPVNHYRLSNATYYRMYAADLLPVSIDRILYLDCDIIVDRSLKHLFSMDMEGVSVYVVQDILDISFGTDADYAERLSYPAEAGLFNAGVLLINLDYWRHNNVGDKCRECLERYSDKLVYYDQDILNKVLWDSKRFIPVDYNFQVLLLSKKVLGGMVPEWSKEILYASTSPAIIHYSYSIKPASILYYKLPYRREWERYKSLSPWRRCYKALPETKKINWIIKRYFLWPLGIMKYDSGFVTVR